MELSDVLAQLSDELPAVLQKVATEAHDLRWGIAPGSISEGPADLHERLLDVRRAQDRLEEIAAQVGRLHSRAAVVVADLQGKLDDAEATTDLPSMDFSSAKERNARLMLATFEERRALRKAQRQKAEIDEVWEYVRTLHRGIDGARRDLDLRIRLLSMTTMLEH